MKKKSVAFPTPAETELFTRQDAGTQLTKLLEDAHVVFVKKLSLNDRDWARLPNKHQAGVYIPTLERDGGFFPALIKKVRDSANAEEIRETFFDIEWPETGEMKNGRLVHYTSKGEETHLTRLPKTAFRELAPASFLVIGRRESQYRALTIDSESDDYALLSDILSLPPDFRCGVFDLALIQSKREEKTLTFVEEVVKAYFDGSITSLIEQYSIMPRTTDLAAAARSRYMAENGLKRLDPFSMATPGDAIRAISRGVEYEIFKDLQIRGRTLELVRLIFGDDPKAVTPENALRAIIVEFPKIDALLLSAAQQRKSRAGYSFEHHIEAMLIGGGVPFEKQVVIESKKRPDFILPGVALYADAERAKDEALVLSAKTTLRERWKQVSQEMRNCDLYLATVDENIAANAIQDMAAQGITLVVPESLKASDTTEYKKQANVLSFRSFFDQELGRNRWPLWVKRGFVLPRT